MKLTGFGTDCYRYVIARIIFKVTKPVHYELALKDNKDLSVIDCESYIGFTLDAGLDTTIDEALYMHTKTLLPIGRPISMQKIRNSI
ncbi:DUF4241 domain-containing protein [Veillonella caviae]|uniref:DUF4241 domain-containing protein n=1 Tax=Veillonella caviae TaxID=248316 RepID=UPI002A82E46A|nr:DUF4241 domain-containing protein [Veillonella caviae]MDY4746163.1 DUF4241 domain-containing protein [Veillonella caviae]MDY5409731.1 DUF4241 domain-containing protein [Veillonella caviae]MDY5480778.1 DUF4241 domain-containing protein [Veillonella caviae]